MGTSLPFRIEESLEWEKSGKRASVKAKGRLSGRNGLVTDSSFGILPIPRSSEIRLGTKKARNVYSDCESTLRQRLVLQNRIDFTKIGTNAPEIHGGIVP